MTEQAIQEELERLDFVPLEERQTFILLMETAQAARCLAAAARDDESIATLAALERHMIGWYGSKIVGDNLLRLAHDGAGAEVFEYFRERCIHFRDKHYNPERDTGSPFRLSDEDWLVSTAIWEALVTSDWAGTGNCQRTWLAAVARNILRDRKNLDDCEHLKIAKAGCVFAEGELETVASFVQEISVGLEPVIDLTGFSGSEILKRSIQLITSGKTEDQAAQAQNLKGAKQLRQKLKRAISGLDKESRTQLHDALAGVNRIPAVYVDELARVNAKLRTKTTAKLSPDREGVDVTRARSIGVGRLPSKFEKNKFQNVEANSRSREIYSMRERKS